MTGPKPHSKCNPFNKIRKHFALRSFRLEKCLVLTLALATLWGMTLRADAVSGDHDRANSSASAPELQRLEMQMWEMVNRDRTSPSVLGETKGRARFLEWDARLAAVARAHSEEMASTGSFSHRGLDGSTPMTRVSHAGIPWRALGENIARFEDVAEAEVSFMDEPKFQPNHRGNILNPAYNHLGIGIARGSDGSLYITQEFAQIP
jgi:uncharacterized protein YkwD